MTGLQVRLKVEDAQLIADVLGAVVAGDEQQYGPEEIAPVQARFHYLAARARARDARDARA